MRNLLSALLACHPVIVAGLWLFAADSAAAEPDGVFPAERWHKAAPAEVGLDASKLHQARDYALTGEGSGYVVRRGRLVLAWGDPRRRYDLKSTTKSIGVTALGLAVADGKIQLSDKVVKHHPAFGVPPEENARTGWLDHVTIEHLARQTAGFEKPGGYTKLLFEPGTKWDYSDSGPNWLAECVTLAYRRDVRDLMFERVFTPIGIRDADLTWRKNAYRPENIDDVPRREFGSGIHANVDAMARIGLLYLNRGSWNGKRLVPAEFIDRATATDPDVARLEVHKPRDYGKASQHYGLLWWNNSDGTLANVRSDAYWSWGLYDSLIVVIPSLDLVVARAGKSWKRTGDEHYAVLQPFLEPIVAAVVDAEAINNEPNEDGTCEDNSTVAVQADVRGAPYPPSPFITKLTWAPPETIIRKARGSDNWPMTWTDDDALYTAYGDGWGFEPRVKKKLSLGLARVTGSADDFTGRNILSETGQQVGDGRHGKKASGMLMVDGRLYMWGRNAENSQLAWSDDYAKTWTWSDWRFTTSFGCPTFLNFGKNYAGARDDYVYTYSHDNDSAYQPADRMVLARVPRDRIAQQAHYEFFQSLDDEKNPVWTSDIRERGAVFDHPGRCYRSGITYNPGLKRYLWCQIIPGDDTRFRGGFGIYDAPEPWGPWTTVFFTENWDVGPGETSSIPTKWISGDGKTVHLVFSGNDDFAVRRANLTVAE